MADPTTEQYELAEALDDLISDRGVSLDDDRLDFLAEFIAAREDAARAEGYLQGVQTTLAAITTGADRG